MDSQEKNNQTTMPNPLAVMQPGERIVCEIKRHPIGIFITFLVSGLLLVALAVIAFVAVPNVIGDGSGGIKVLSGLAFFVFAILDLVFVFIANIVYWGNHWIITSDSITQMEQTSLFHKESSQLSLGNLEDMAAEKKGILATMFNFGTLKAETAGEREKFTLAFCPNPEHYAQMILAEREIFEQGHHGGKQEPYVAASPAPAQANPNQAGQLGQAALADFPDQAQEN